MAKLFYVFGAILVWGIVQADVISGNGGEAFVEDIRAAYPRVVGGYIAQKGQFPHQAALRLVSGTGNVATCGGSIIHHEWVLTAAHCLNGRVSIVVRLGLTNDTRPEYLLETTRKYIHPRYITSIGGVQTDDIALLGLDTAVAYGPNIQPGRLQNSDQKNINYEGVVLTVSGFGRTGVWQPTSEVLRWTHLRGITNEECRSWYSSSQVVQEQIICAENYYDTPNSPCQGDSGGPMIHPDIDGKPTLVGVVSFAHSSGCEGPYPSGYVRPGHYHAWFTEVTGLDFDWRSEDLEVAEEHHM